MVAELTRILEDFISSSFDCSEVAIEFFKVLIDGAWDWEASWTWAEMKEQYDGSPYASTCPLSM